MDQKGWIALDIDGTITLDKYSVPQEVVSYLCHLQKEGWNIAFATGRPLAFAARALSQFHFPYTFLAQNGTAVLEMPNQKLLFTRYLSPSVIPLVERCYEGIDSDFLIYSGYESGDFCFWRPHRLHEEAIHYLGDLQNRQKESWRSVSDFDGITENFPLIKCFGFEKEINTIAKRLKQTGLFQVSTIRDPFAEGYFLLLVTDKQASKGISLEEVFKLKGRGGCVIAAGDDENDISLLQVADIKIAMSHAPESLKQMADFTALPTKQLGIIPALKRAIDHAK